MALTVLSPLLLALILGIASHHSIFIRGELNDYADRILFAFLAGYTFLIVIESSLEDSLVSGLLAATVLFALFQIGLCGSILTYRLFFHRLRSFPGSYFDAASNWSAVFRARSRNQYHLELASLHERYGDFVRTGE